MFYVLDDRAAVGSKCNKYPQDPAMFMTHQSFLQRMSSIVMAPSQTYKFPFDVFLPLVLVLPIAALFQPLVAFVCFLTFVFCYVMQSIATLEQRQMPLPPDAVLSPAASASSQQDQYADPIGS